MSFDQKHLILQNNFQLDFMNAKDKKKFDYPYSSLAYNMSN